MLFQNSQIRQQRLRFFQIIQRYVDAGMSPADSLERFRETLEKDSPILNMTNVMLRDMRNGKSFSEVLHKFPKFFPPFIIGLVEVGQESGQLPRILKEIVYHLEQDIDIKRKIDSATMIPKISPCLIEMLAFSTALKVFLPLVKVLYISFSSIMFVSAIKPPDIIYSFILLSNIYQSDR